LAKALSSHFDKHIFQTRLLQANVGQFQALLVNPFHQIDKSGSRTPGTNG
jgi:hypothetical protein